VLVICLSSPQQAAGYSTNKQKNVKHVEDLIVKSTTNEMNELDDEHLLRKFVHHLKAELGDDADFVLLKASEKLDLRNQKLILTILNE